MRGSCSSFEMEVGFMKDPTRNLCWELNFIGAATSPSLMSTTAHLSDMLDVVLINPATLAEYTELVESGAQLTYDYSER